MKLLLRQTFTMFYIGFYIQMYFRNNYVEFFVTINDLILYDVLCDFIILMEPLCVMYTYAFRSVNFM